MKKLGILGGMGPLAGAYFFFLFSAWTSAESDDCHPEVVLYSATGIPDRTAGLTGHGSSPLPALRKATAFLCDSGAEVLVMTCNTAHAYFAELQDASAGRFLSMPDLAVAEAIRCGAGRIGVLSTSGCAAAGVYRSACFRAGADYIPTPEPVQKAVNEAIYRKKAGENINPSAFLPAIAALLNAGADRVILGCTEISLIFAGRTYPDVTDALEVLAKEAVVACGAFCRPEGERRSDDLYAAYR